MSLLSRLLPKGLANLSRVTTGIKAYSETPGVLWAERTRSTAGVVVDEEAALTLSAVFAACYRLASLQAQLPIGIYERAEKGRVEKPENPASNLLNVQLSPDQTAFTGRFFMDFWKPLFGAACAEIVWDNAARASQIHPIGPWRVQVKQDERSDQIYYLVDGRRRVHPDDMLYVPHITNDGVTGLGFVQYAIESLGSAIAADRAAGRFFKNDMRPGGMLRHPGSPNDTARKRFRQEWQDNHGGDKQGSIGVLWGGWDWIKDSGAIDPNKAQLLESRSFSLLEVCRWLNVPPHFIFELGRATWSNLESMQIEMLTHVLTPLLVAKEQEYDRKLLSPPRLYCKHNVNALMRGDSETRGKFYQMMHGMGALSINEIRAFEDQNGIGKDGDIRFVPVNYQPLNDLMTGMSAAKEIAESKPEPAPKAEAKPAVDKPKKKAAMSVAGVLEHLLTMLSKKECNEANRASKKPKVFMAWMDSFYESHQSLMESALHPASELMCGLLDEEAGPRLNNWSGEWCRKSREELLDSMDGPPEEWPNRMTDLLSRWQSRPAEMALEWTKPLLLKEMAE